MNRGEEVSQRLALDRSNIFKPDDLGWKSLAAVETLNNFEHPVDLSEIRRNLALFLDTFTTTF